MEAQRREHDILPILQDPALPRTEAQRRGLDILQILQALLDIGNPTENATEHLPLSAHEMWDLQQHHRTLIAHLYVLLPILFLTRQQEPYRAELGRVGRTLLIELLSLRQNYEVELPDWIHAQYFLTPVDQPSSGPQDDSFSTGSRLGGYIEHLDPPKWYAGQNSRPPG